MIIDDDTSLNEALETLLSDAGYSVFCAESGESGIEIVRKEPIDLVLLDLRLEDISGLDLLTQIKSVRAETSVIMITGVGTIEDAVEAMRRGADNFIVKPVDPPRLLVLVEKGFESGSLRRKAAQLERLSNAARVLFLGKARAIQDAIKLIEVVAPRDTTVLLRGETGTGKGLIARRIHETSPRSKHPFVELNCAGLQRDLTESELFGHERGSFTGAHERKIGLFEAANGGTLFLDEIGEMDYSIQPKLLNVLEQKRFRRIGGVAEIEVDVRLIAATHRDLTKEITAGKFREDLFYRLNVFTIPVPPLRQRKEDILSLAEKFLQEFGGVQDGISHEAAELLSSYDWPGNVRELRNVMERAAILCPSRSQVLISHLPQFTGPSDAHTRSRSEPLTVNDAELKLFELALRTHNYNLKATARDLGVSRGTLYRKIKKHKIALPKT